MHSSSPAAYAAFLPTPPNSTPLHEVQQATARGLRPEALRETFTPESSGGGRPLMGAGSRK